MNLCACGCKTPVNRTWKKGHNARVTVDRNREIRARARSGETFTAIGKEFGISHQRVDQIVNQDRHRARHAVARAVKDGRLSKPAKCEYCLRRPVEQAHHSDYSKRLEVMWLCGICHAVVDRLRRFQDRRDRLNEDAGDLLYPREAAEYLGVAYCTLLVYRRKGLIRGERLTRQRFAFRTVELDAFRLTLKPALPDLCSKGHRLTTDNVRWHLQSGRPAQWFCRACNCERVAKVTGRERQAMSMYATRQAVRLAGFAIVKTSSHTIRAIRGDETLSMSRGKGGPWLFEIRWPDGVENHRVATLSRLTRLIQIRRAIKASA